ncbi:Poly(3-hydroxyalkanoate) synthetase [Halalkaliarchaeum sp. AArc-CO]|uniref:helix-hairpin-helix domain-containing protein n=1 Tax=unclassified Halalkaliarchaeum TaxID=2678344 RepID=UPI00217D9722|nr:MULTISPECIES: helix-hairpin-helix domain-containing protein [unclassified Halalkaliarchaeum]MDR5672173.1 helix-hairpin-helix domain-containing protein [Halalkaliarchaeum sp. AArc-GB]UWG51679.1 Poly(3-hydroxyalkanoate) synthetase [Halalkaliarchaeum sp. AArc-CO]
MALLQKLKELLGIGGGDDRTERGDTEVTVERDPDPESGPEPESGPPGEADEGEGADDESTDETPEGREEPTGEADGEEPTGEADEDAKEDRTEDHEDDGDADETAGEELAEESDDGEPVQKIKGIGPAYADRLGEIGIHTVPQLAAADPGAVAEGAKVGEGRASTWIERANEQQ